jgi:hypothetical protein
MGARVKAENWGQLAISGTITLNCHFCLHNQRCARSECFKRYKFNELKVLSPYFQKGGAPRLRLSLHCQRLRTFFRRNHNEIEKMLWKRMNLPGFARLWVGWQGGFLNWRKRRLSATVTRL